MARERCKLAIVECILLPPARLDSPHAQLEASLERVRSFPNSTVACELQTSPPNSAGSLDKHRQATVFSVPSRTCESNLLVWLCFRTQFSRSTRVKGVWSPALPTCTSRGGPCPRLVRCEIPMEALARRDGRGFFFSHTFVAVASTPRQIAPRVPNLASASRSRPPFHLFALAIDTARKL
jgi:hypothetical protein